ncbi:MAG: glycine cleavage system protein H [Desulfobacteraceae bacterium]|nr:MAG: glycine cleavage system protein H [Desulfobacteraceae bacterium]
MEIQGYNIPDDLYYEEHHFWVRKEGDILVMGMDDFAQKLAGDIAYVQLPFEGKMLSAGNKFAKVESGKWVGKVFAPVDGEILTSNSELEKEPGLINQDCYGSGWMYKIKPNNSSDLEMLIHEAGAIEKWMLGDIEKYKKK